METQSNARLFGMVGLSAARIVATLSCLLGTFLAAAAPLTINVIGVAADGSQTSVTNTSDYRWTVEEDATKPSVPGQAATAANYSFSFHTSYMPVLAAGRIVNGAKAVAPVPADPDLVRLYSKAPTDLNLDAAKRYYVSVAAVGYQMGAAPVVFNAAGTTATATVYVNRYDLPTAQLSVFAFEDNNPINGAPDLPQEQGLAGFTVQLLEAGGTYGQSGGTVTQDAFANPLGTTYNADGTVKVRGKGIILTGPDGTATFKNLYPAKYTVIIVPPVGSDWHQTSTIEGGYGSDAWVKNNEPTFFQEFGPPGHHVFIGFTKSGYIARNPGPAGGPVLNGGKTITGRVVNTHHSRPPIYTFEKGAPVTECWVGLNEANGGRALYATACNKDSTFSIPSVPAGTYELVIWDTPLDIIIGATTITVAAADTTKALGDLPVSSWFGRYQGRVFQDIDGTGLPYFATDFNRPYIEVDPVTYLEKEVTKEYKAGDLKPPFGEGIASNIRFRDGSIYQSTTTKRDGTFAFTEVFPFFNWMIAEIDYARFKASGATMVVDEGGCIKVSDTDCAAEPGKSTNGAALWKAEPGLFGSNDPALKYDPWTRLNPQLQPENANKAFRNESCLDNLDAPGQCAILLEGMATFLSSTNHIEWGKQPYAFNENGGIAGIVHYAITRAEDDPRFAAAENWEPGIPRVQVNLFLDCDGDGKPDQPSNDGSGTCAKLSTDLVPYAYDPPDVDNYPYCWRDAEFVAGNPGLCPTGMAKGAEDIKRSAVGGTAFSYGDVFRWGAPNLTVAAQLHIGLGKTDSWDDSIPTGCPFSTPTPGAAPTPYTVPATGEQLDCYDGLRNYNQLRPAVFDGGYAFGRVAGQAELPMFIGAEGKGTYVVEAVAPPGYLHQGNGDKNVVFGDSLQASSAALPFACVGKELDVPATLTLFPGEDNPNYLAGQRKWNKCDMKAVPLVPGTNPAPDFFMFTEAPVAGHGVGFILDDTSTEFNYLAPTFGEKYSPPHLPVSVQDWTGREISRVYSDQFGSYNFLVPSSFTINPPYPSGVMPSMMVACMNHPGPITDPNDPTKKIIDPYFNRNYTQFCYTLQYLPGKTTYLDTPVLPISAFASVDKNPLDCECADGTPAIYSATNGSNGPWVPAAGGTLTIVSQGSAEVVNPAYDPTVVWPAPAVLAAGYSVATGAADLRLKKTVTRDYGFGNAAGSITLGGTPLTSVVWSAGLITATVPNAASTGQLSIKRGDNGKESVVGLTVHVGGGQASVRKVNPGGTDSATCGLGTTPCKTIQAAIEAASNGDLITIAPGTYNEYVILDKRVRLQGWGAGSVTINAAKSSAGGLAAWRALLNKKIDPRCAAADGVTPIANSNPAACPATTPIDPDTNQPTIVAGTARTFDILPSQTIGHNAANNEPILFGAEEGPGVLVVGRALPLIGGCLNSGVQNLRIDGLTVTGSDSGGGILANGYDCGVQISNNRVVANYGTYGGGIRIGHTDLVTETVTANGTEVITPTDSFNRNPNIHHNFVVQNGATEAGGAGGITMGTGSNSYEVTSNYVCGNFSMADGGGLSHLGFSGGTNLIAKNKFIFNQTFNQSADPTGGGVFIGGQIPVGTAALEGTGNVVVNANLMQGNQAGAGAGGGMSIARTRRADQILLTNNMIVNNVAAYAGGGVAMLGNNSVSLRVVNNTIASNVSTATNRQSFTANAASTPSNPQVAGLAVLDGTGPALMVNNILWANRSYIFEVSGATAGLHDPAGGPSYRDLGRVAGAATFAPVNSLFTTGGVNDHVTSSPTNIFRAATDITLFVKANDFSSVIDRNQPLVLADTTVTLQTALTFDETGNFVNVIFSPLTLWDFTGSNAGQLRADYHLVTGSAAVDAAVSPTASNFVPTTDYDGETRPTGTAYDIGADEISPPVSVQPSSLAFGSQSINTTATQTLTVTNSGATAATVPTPTITGTNAGQFGFTNNCPASLAPSTSCTITVSFTPTSNGSKTATLNVITFAIPLSGTGVTPLYTVTPVLHAFGQQQVGTVSAPFAYTVTNTALSQGSLVLTGANAIVSAQFAAAAGGTCFAGISLPPGSSCTMNVTFNPTSNGLKTGTVAAPVTAGAAGAPALATGTGLAPNLSLGAGTFNFGVVANLANSTFTLTNNQTPIVATAAPFVIGSISAAKTNSGVGNYVVTGGTCAVGATLAVNATCTVIVQFQSPTSSLTTGTLTVSGAGVGGIGTFSAVRNLTGS